MPSLISVLISSYNHEEYVQKSIQSIINQTYKNIELIVIDDGSSDNTWEKICDLKYECISRFANVIMKKQSNKGFGQTLNDLLSLSVGEYIFIIASDDVADKDAINILYDFLSKNDSYALAVGANNIIDSNGDICYWDRKRNNVYSNTEAVYKSFSDYLIKRNKKINFDSDDFGSYASLIRGNYIPNGSLVRKSIYERIEPYTREAPLEDYFRNLQIAKCSKMKYISQTTFYYRWHGRNTASHAKKMDFLTNKTRMYEVELAMRLKESSFDKILSDNFEVNFDTLNNCYYTVQYIINIPFFKLYKYRSKIKKKVVFRIFWLNICFNKRSFVDLMST